MSDFNFPDHSSFTSDTLIQFPNASGTNVNAMEMVTSMTDTTAGSEDSQFVIKLITAGVANTTALSVTGGQVLVPAGTVVGPAPGLAIGDPASGFSYVAGGPNFRISIGGRSHYLYSNGFYLDGTTDGGFFLDGSGSSGLPYTVSGTKLQFKAGGTISMSANATGLSFFNVTTPIAQPSTTGTATGFTAGAGTTATHLSTFTGNTGSTAYTTGDIVRALKLLGLMAA